MSHRSLDQAPMGGLKLLPTWHPRCSCNRDQNARSL